MDLKKHKYYIFDFDDNIVHMPTTTKVLHIESDETVEWTSEDYAKVKESDTFHQYEPIDGDWSKSYKDFGDLYMEPDEPNRFLRDINIALDSSQDCLGPSHRAFKKCLIEGHRFAILTARGHEPETLREGIRVLITRLLTLNELDLSMKNFNKIYPDLLLDRIHMIKNRLSEETLYDILDDYLDHCYFIGISSPSFMQSQDMDLRSANFNGKSVALHDIIDYFYRTTPDELKHDPTNPISIGFSDDDKINQQTVRQVIVDQLCHDYPEIKFCLYKTNDRGYIKEVLYSPNI